MLANLDIAMVDVCVGVGCAIVWEREEQGTEAQCKGKKQCFFLDDARLPMATRCLRVSVVSDAMVPTQR
jgi:hypothetical protein